MRPLLGALLGLALLAAGCGDDDTAATGNTGSQPPDDGSAGGGADPDGLVGRTFLSESVTEDGQPRALVEGTRIELSFPDATTLNVTGGCNHLFGSLEIQPDRLVASALGGTEMACEPPAVMDQDAWLSELFDSDPSYRLDGDRLRLESDGTVIELVDREVADPDRPLEGTTWTLDGIVDGEAVSSVPGGVEATMVIESGSVEVTVQDCVPGSGQATIGDDTIDFDITWAVSDAPCPPDPDTVQRALEAALDGEVDYEIEAGSLTVTLPSGQGLTFTAP